MEMICPVCMGTLTSGDGQTARCTIHGGEFRILCTRIPVSPPPVEVNLALTDHVLTADARCAQHPGVAAVHACAGCGTPMCETCAFPAANGARICVACATKQAQAVKIFGKIPAGMHCVQHPTVAATVQCQSCGAYMCATCDFALPGGLHVCPSCATAPKVGLSAKRRGPLIGSFALAVWGTVLTVLIFSGALAGMGEQAVGTVLWLGVLIPSLIGLGLGVSTMERRLGNPPVLWIAVAWNGAILAGIVLLFLIGLTMR